MTDSSTLALEPKPEQKSPQLAALREIGRALHSTWDLKATLELITCTTAGVMDMGSCSMYLQENERLLDIAVDDLPSLDGRLCAPVEIFRRATATHMTVPS